jgi:CRP/FNR family transcriptional regulator, cyclic AMP receptor protein
MKAHLPYGMKLLDNYTTCSLRNEGFFRQMADDSLIAFEKVRFTSWYPTEAVLFVEGQVPRGAYMLCQGRVKLSMASAEGKTIIVRVAKAGELLGLHCVVSGEMYEVTAETLQPCQVDFVRQEDLLRLLHEHQDIAVSVMQQFNCYYRGACQQVRRLGLSATADEKLAGFLLESAGRGKKTQRGLRFSLSLTHEEIAQTVGLTRESITRAFTKFRHLSLIATKGATVLIRNKAALEKMIA